MKIEILWAMFLVTTAFGAVVARDIPLGPDMKVDDLMISEEKNVKNYWNDTAELNSHSVRMKVLQNIVCNFNGEYMEHPTCCYKYVRCSWFSPIALVPIEHSCPPGTGWSDSSPPCDHIHNTNCGPRPPKDNQIVPATPLAPVKCSCGTSKHIKRILGGVTVTPPQKWPWQVGLRPVSGPGNTALPGDKIFCGGSIINNQYVLTAAHCFYDSIRSCVYNPSQTLHAHIGEHDQDSYTEDNKVTNILIRVIKIIIHPCYNCKSSASPNDFALLKLAKPIIFNIDIRPVCLPDDDSKTYVGETATVAGWGGTYFVQYPSKLQELDVIILDNSKCGLLPTSKVTPNHLCAQEPNAWFKNHCHGDSGGPLVVKDSNSRFVQVGVVDYTVEGCIAPGYPGVHGRVSKVLDWIKTTSASGQYCDN